MDINQPSLSSRKTNIASSIPVKSDVNSDVSSIRSKDTRMSSTNQDAAHLDWKQGQILKGEIVDRKYNEVSLAIKPGSQVVTAKLSGDVPLSIGQTASFKVTDDVNGQYTLKYMPTGTDTSSNPTITKALTASNLALTDRNKSIVSELLNNNMPIDKQTLQTLVKLSYTNRDASALTLVLMMKNKIPLTSSNIRQFEAFQNGTSRLLDDIHNITNNLMEQLSDVGSENTDNAIALNGKLLDILTSDSTSGTTYGTTQTITTPDTAINKFLSPSDLNLLSNTLVQKMSDGSNIPSSMQSELAQQLHEGSISLSDTIKLITELYPAASDIMNDSSNTVNVAINESGNILNAAMNEIPQGELIGQITGNLSGGIQTGGIQTSGNEVTQTTLNLAGQASTATPQAGIPQTATPIITSLFEQFSTLQNSQNEIGKLLNPNEQKNLMEQLGSLPGADEIKSKIADGTATVKDVLSFVQNSLTKAETTAVKALLQSPVYETLMNESFHQKWTVSPEKLANKEAMMKFYEDLQTDMVKLHDALSSSKNLAENMQSQSSPKNLQENLSFLKDLNQAFTFQQLPLQFKDQDVHSDLYVYTNKNAMNDKSGVHSVLLHLTMKNLGPINVHIKMDHNIIQANFYLEDHESRQIISDNLSSLSSALKKKGYNLHADVRTDYKEPDFCKDFIEQNSQENNFKRYSFDIRT